MSLPHILIFIGSILAIIGTFWASAQQNYYDKEMRKKAEETLFSVTGGNSYPIVNINLSPDNDYFSPVIINYGEYTLYDVIVRYVDVSTNDLTGKVVEIGNISNGSAMVSQNQKFPLRQDLGKESYNIFLSARNGFFNQSLRLVLINGIWKKAIKVTDFSGKILYLQSDEGFPRDSDGNPIWS